jgi:hypothetical protein
MPSPSRAYNRRKHGKSPSREQKRDSKEARGAETSNNILEFKTKKGGNNHEQWRELLGTEGGKAYGRAFSYLLQHGSFRPVEEITAQTEFGDLYAGAIDPRDSVTEEQEQEEESASVAQQSSTSSSNTTLRTRTRLGTAASLAARPRTLTKTESEILGKLRYDALSLHKEERDQRTSIYQCQERAWNRSRRAWTAPKLVCVQCYSSSRSSVNTLEVG